MKGALGMGREGGKRGGRRGERGPRASLPLVGQLGGMEGLLHPRPVEVLLHLVVNAGVVFPCPQGAISPSGLQPLGGQIHASLGLEGRGKWGLMGDREGDKRRNSGGME